MSGDEPFERPPGCTCKDPREICSACWNVPRAGRKPPPPQVCYTTRAMKLVGALAKWTSNFLDVEHWLERKQREKKDPLSLDDVAEAMNHLKREGL